ncbi:hypothetical protein GWI33_008718 [Rhynchophorus ferrugineus]|uniref:Uncharacterized protein n=1 Tax=Rhynchophorus ferrugineus TaxID=354439 RepID=A0A834MGA9_RHYFE|nr:hypothetical protein GWI33_008718 [Rhynchophorus ferrugineus]
MCDSRPGGAEMSQLDQCVTAGLGGRGVSVNVKEIDVRGESGEIQKGLKYVGDYFVSLCVRKLPLKSTLHNNNPLPFKDFLAITTFTRSHGPREAEISQVDQCMTAGQAVPGGLRPVCENRLLSRDRGGVSSRPRCDSRPGGAEVS